MKQRDMRNMWVAAAVATLWFLGISLNAGGGAHAAENVPDNYDNQGKKLFTAYNSAPENYLGAASGDRNLTGFYELRQYSGSPPRIPHPVDLTFSGNETDCLSCHGKGGYSPVFGKYVPVTPHPENTLCYQCHAQVTTTTPFVATTWQSVATPRLGRPFLASSPPPIPHALQLRENCIACHTGPGAVVEIRVAHASRGDCRQCHAPALQQEKMAEFQKK